MSSLIPPLSHSQPIPPISADHPRLVSMCHIFFNCAVMFYMDFEDFNHIVSKALSLNVMCSYGLKLP
jgi:hypothetical protein